MRRLTRMLCAALGPMRVGKMTAYDTDIHVPLVIVGPGIKAGQTSDAATLPNVDIDHRNARSRPRCLTR